MAISTGLGLALAGGLSAGSSLLGGIMGKGGADASGAAAGQAGINAWQHSLDAASANKALASPYLLSGYAGTNALMKAFGLGHLNPFNTDGGTRSTAYGETSLNTDNVAGDRANALADFQASPGYQWRLDQGAKALDRSAASKGGLFSGAQGQALTNFNQNQASGEWDNYIKGLFGLSGQGASVTNATNAADTSAMNAGNALGMQGAMGQASQYANGANALASGISSAANNFSTMLGGFGGRSGGGGGSGFGADLSNPLSLTRV